MEGSYLNASELLKYFSGTITELPQRGGAKEYAPDGSWLQEKRTQLFNEERHRVLSEERVKKKGHLRRGDWKPELGKVELVGKTGKFLMTCGHGEKGRFFLHPEEALSQLEKGDIEVYYGGLPLSVQEAYSTMLTGRVPLEHYQVYNHLSRLGYIIHRHVPVPKITRYERLLGLTNKDSKKKKKRKGPQIQDDNSKVAKLENNEDAAWQKPECDQALQPMANTQTNSELIADTASANKRTDIRNVSDMDCTNKIPDSTCGNVHRQHESNSSSDHEQTNPLFVEELDKWCYESDREQTCRTYSDFTGIHLPNLVGDKEEQNFDVPDPCWLPPGITLAEDFKIMNIHQDRPTPSEPHTANLDFSFGCLRSKVKASNWTEYKQNSVTVSEDDLLLTSPVAHLWSGDVQPLIKPSEALSTASLLDRMKFVENINFTDDADKYSSNAESTTEFVYDVYQPDRDFSKNDPGLPIFRLCIKRQDEPCPDLADLLRVARLSSDGVPVQWAVVDSGDVTFYSFNGVDLPRDITMQ